jgi:hypothetical protein
MTTDAGSGFDKQAAGRDAGDERLEEEIRPSGDDDDAAEEEHERRHSHDSVNDAFGGPGGA